MSTEVQNQRDEERARLLNEVDDYTAFVVTGNVTPEALIEAFRGGNDPDAQSLVKFTLKPYLVENRLTAVPFKDKNCYEVGVAVRQLGYVSANDQVFNVWGYVVEAPDNIGSYLHEGGAFTFGSLLYLCYDAMSQNGLLLKIHTEPVFDAGEVVRHSIDYDLRFTSSLCPALGEMASIGMMQSGMLPLAFPIDYRSREFDVKRYVREQLDEKFKRNGDPKQQKQSTEEEEIPEEAEETEGADESGVLTPEEMKALLGDGKEQESSGGDEVKSLVP